MDSSFSRHTTVHRLGGNGLETSEADTSKAPSHCLSSDAHMETEGLNPSVTPSNPHRKDVYSRSAGSLSSESSANLLDGSHRTALLPRGSTREAPDIRQVEHVQGHDGVSADMEMVAEDEGNNLPRLPNSSRFWAVLIGIDGYPYYPLHGCVSDAKLMEKYLVENLGVPKNRIQLLLGGDDLDTVSSPTRANILRTLYSLIDNTLLGTAHAMLLRNITVAEHRRESPWHQSVPSKPYVL
ncbi:hypothetical protein ARMSODRAFT_1087990 [Armillaria solidipes]|uniref:Peptidase C14 caspase domain-containing protein n=1 Tax=Armillaria solidipes TaxID=1076256 RepID=A0A2H3BL58_9AGAR|nr:hypothetical protein ARMSODRAFT_1087990 [Armillaria solidipes]